MIERLIRFKIYWQRSAQYESIVKAVVYIALIYKLWEDDPLGVWLKEHKSIAVPIIVFVYLLYRLVVGYLDKKIIRPKEFIENQKTNPQFMDILKTVKDINKKLE